MSTIKNILLSEEGAETTENILWNVIWALGGAAVAFGLLQVARVQGGKASADLGAVKTPGTLPTAAEVKTPSAGGTGAVTGLQ